MKGFFSSPRQSLLCGAPQVLELAEDASLGGGLPKGVLGLTENHESAGSSG